jgi:hypothetical protein
MKGNDQISTRCLQPESLGVFVAVEEGRKEKSRVKTLASTWSEAIEENERAGSGIYKFNL